MAEIPEEALSCPAESREGFYSAKDPVSVLASRKETSGLLEKTLFLAFKLGEYAKMDVQGMLKRFPDGPLGEIGPLKGDPELLAAVNWKLNQIAKG